MNNTLADIRRTAESNVATGTDANTPPGTFFATARIFGLIRTYLLDGQPDDENAPILGVIVSSPAESTVGSIDAYVTSGLMGGSWFLYRGLEDAYRQIAERAAR